MDALTARVPVAAERIHRAPFGAGFIANGVLLTALLGAVFAAFLATADRMLKAGWSSQFEVAVAIASALGIGMFLQANYARCIRFVDRVFLPRRYASRIALDRIAVSLRQREMSMSDHLAGRIAEALGLSTVAIFTRTADGGFVRRAAFGWPAGSTWHLLPGDAMTLALRGRNRLVWLADVTDTGVALPDERGRPCVAIVFRRRRSVRSAIVLGSDNLGGIPDADIVRELGSLLGEFVTG